ncbi:transmembrane channel-like protein 6 [Tachypleus tridentatus]|uniref:transmembrane channel-like protein 6 n=1 Tax=Tachypleus tridentatus TaxID=6853 RepID=UPI003FD20A7F
MMSHYHKDDGSHSSSPSYFHDEPENIPMQCVEQFKDRGPQHYTNPTEWTQDYHPQTLRRRHSSNSGSTSGPDEPRLRRNYSSNTLESKSSRVKKYSSTTMDLIQQLPSRQDDYTDDEEVQQCEINSQTSTVKRAKVKRHESHYKTIRFRGIPAKCETETEKDNLFKKLKSDQDDAPEEIREKLRELHQSLTTKRSLRKQLTRYEKQQQESKTVSLKNRMKFAIQMQWDQLKYNTKELLSSFDLWHFHLKMIQGHFGSSVASYFLFLRWLLFLNCGLFLVLFGFIIIPQIIWFNSQDSQSEAEQSENVSFTGLELLTGAGHFTNSYMYYGFYTNETVGGRRDKNKNPISGGYSIPRAYLLVNCAYFIICIVVITFSLARSYKKNYLTASGELKNVFSTKIFSAWDYSIETPKAAKLKSHSIYNEIQELLSAHSHVEIKDTCSTKLMKLLGFFGINIFIMAVIGGIGYLIFFILKKSVIEDGLAKNFVEQMELSFVVSLITNSIPVIFVFLSKYEMLQSKETQLYFNMIKIVFMKAVILAILVFFWLFADLDMLNLENPLNITKNASICWETELGQELYRLQVVDLLFVLFISTFLGEFVRKIVHKFCCTSVSSPEFNIANNILDLIYTQTLAWLGAFYSPLLSVVVIIKLIIIFYTKRFSVMSNCEPSLKPWRAAHGTTVFLTLILIHLLLTVAAFGCSIFLENVSPSNDCGPFRGIQAVDILVRDPKEQGWLAVVFRLLTSAPVIAGILLFLLVGVYYLRATAKAHKNIVDLLREQLILEGKDRVFLLQLFESALRERGASASTSSSEGMIKTVTDAQQLSDDMNSQDKHSLKPVELTNKLYRDKSFASNKPTPQEQDVIPPNFLTPEYMPADVPAHEKLHYSSSKDEPVRVKPGWGRSRHVSPNRESYSASQKYIPSEQGSSPYDRGNYNSQQDRENYPHNVINYSQNQEHLPPRGFSTPHLQNYYIPDSVCPDNNLGFSKTAIPSPPHSSHQQGFQYLGRNDHQLRSQMPRGLHQHTPSPQNFMESRPRRR